MSDSALPFLVLPPLGWALAALWGGLWGSFCNVAIHRLGLYESVVRPPSRCPRCGAPIRARDNIPILSWLWLRGRCRHCGQPISWRYPLVELIAVVLALGIYSRFVAADSHGDAIALLARFFVYFAFSATLLILAGVDVEQQLIPDAVTYPAVPLFLVCGIVLRDVPARDLLIGVAAGYGVIAVPLELAYVASGRDVLGYGDAKLLMVVGALLGWGGVLFALFSGALFGSLVAIPIRLVQRRQVFGVTVPFGPFLAAGALLYLVAGRMFLAMLTG
jgi:leader peptidase (prepilin peptidase)/N-methyltransferase